MLMRLSVLLLIFSSFFIFESALGQIDTSQNVVVVTYDGKERVGKILSDDGREILLLTTSLGKIYISKENIKEIRVVEEGEIEAFDGDFRSTGPFTTRYAFTTNALPIKKNEDYAMLNLYGPEVHFSVADNFSVGIMSSWIASPFILALKYTVPTSTEGVNIGFGSLIGTSGYLNTFRGFGNLTWGMITYGDRMKNMTFSAGYLYADLGFIQEFEEPGYYPALVDSFGGWTYPEIPFMEVGSGPIRSPVFSVAGITKVGKKASFVFDSMLFFSEQDIEDRNREDLRDANFDLIAVRVDDNSRTQKQTIIYLMPGMRFQSKDNRAFQISLGGITAIDRDSGETIAFPLPMFSWFAKF